MVRPPVGLRVRGRLWVLKRSIVRHSDGQQVFLGNWFGEVLKDAQFEAVRHCPKTTYHHPQRDIDTVVHGDDFVAVAEDDHLNFLERVLENSMEIKRVGRIGPGRSSWTGDGFTWEADPRTVGKVAETTELDRRKGSNSFQAQRTLGKMIEMSTMSWSMLRPRWCRQQRGLEQYIALDRPRHCLQRQDSTTTDVETHEVDETSNHQGCSVLEEQSKVGPGGFQYQQQPKSIDVFVDADFAARETMLRSTSGVARVSLEKSPIEFGSSTQSVRATVPQGSPEFYAITKGSAHSLHSQAILKAFGVVVEAVVLSDASAGIGIASRQGCGTS